MTNIDTCVIEISRRTLIYTLRSIAKDSDVAAEGYCLFDTVKPGYNDSGYSDNRFKTIRLVGIDYFLKELTIFWLFRLSLAYSKILVEIVIAK